MIGDPSDLDDTLVTVARARALTGMSDTWVRRAVKRGDLIGYRISTRALRISRDSIDRFLAGHRAPTSAGIAAPAPASRPRRPRHAAFRAAERALRDLGI